MAPTAEALAFPHNFAVPLSFKQRTYEFIKLPNGMVGLILADPTEDLVSCCLSVATGHHANPEYIPGLAHLCEHMVCVSSKKYPEVDFYKKKISQSGGSFNALTTNENTSFFFSIPITATSSKETQSSFEEILDIFISNFDHPLFNASYSNREIFSVDNEHTVNKTKKNRLMFQGYKLLANKNHPFTKFSTGDFNSLTESSKKHDIRDHLLKFFNSEYTPNKMSFVLRGPQSLNYLQKLALSNFGRIGTDQKNPDIVIKNVNSLAPLLKSNIIENIWSKKYNCKAFSTAELQKAIIINKDTDTLLCVGFPINFKDFFSAFSLVELQFYIDFWCDIFGSETINTISSALFSKELISSISSKTSTVTYDTILLQIEIAPTTKGEKNINIILDIIINYISIFNVDDKRFVKHLAKSMSQFNGIGMYNFLYSEEGFQSVWEARHLSKLLLSNISLYGQWFLEGSVLFDKTLKGFCGAYNESEDAKKWWTKQAVNYCNFINKSNKLSNILISLVGVIDKFDLDWLYEIPENFQTDIDFNFQYKIAKIKPSVYHQENFNSYNLSLSPPNEFVGDIINNQTKLLEIVQQSIKDSASCSLGYSVKNVSSMENPKLIHYDKGCQLWIKSEIDASFKNKALLSLELINTKIGCDPLYVAILEILVQIVKTRINKYLYSALAMNYCYDLFPSFKGDSGIVLHVSGPVQRFTKVLMILTYELKLVSKTFKEIIGSEEFENAKIAVAHKYKMVNNFSSLEISLFGLMAIMEEHTWTIDQRINACNNLTIEQMGSISPELFSSCYLTAFLQGDVNVNTLEKDILPVITKLVETFEGQEYQFPSCVSLPSGANFSVHSFTKDNTNAIEYFIQVCKRDDSNERSICKFVSFLMQMSLTNKIRGEYQLGYIVLVGMKTLRKIQGIHIAVVSGSYSAADLDARLDALLVEWYEQLIKKMKPSTLNDLVEKFIANETAANSTAHGSPANLLFGVLGNSGGSRKIIKQHNSYWEQIDNKNYHFSGSIGGDDNVDINVIKSLTTTKLNEFIKQKVLQTSKTRSKVAVLVDSKCSKKDVENNLKTIQLYMFLSSMGLPIKKETLEEIVSDSGNSQVVICKQLYKYYRSKGKSITTIAAAMAKLSASFVFMKSQDSSKEAESTVPSEEIDINHILEWQNSIGFYRDTLSMEQKLAAI